MRGALIALERCHEEEGIIPACAGSTDTSASRCACTRDHPRMCGEHSIDAAVRFEAEGSSPHVRGAQVADEAVSLEPGIIPACAVSTLRASWKPSGPRDHPRMCGEHLVRPRHVAQPRGSSPHVRGARSQLDVRAVFHGIIPACAGSTDHDFRFPARSRDHPRMCGEHAKVPRVSRLQ